tara:strand:- start:186 stop:6605 length:6420 start_codon:yes stop_codon:yes gene_type:complete
MAISSITVSDANPVNSITVTDSSSISVVTVGIQGPGGPSSILGRSLKDGYTAGSSDNGAGIIYDHANTRWLSTLDSDASSLNFKIPNLTFTSGQTVTAILDEDNMGSNSNTALATQQSIKAYVDAELTSQDLDFQGDSGGALSIDLDSETLSISGGTGIDTTGSGNAITVAIDSTVTTLTGTQTLTNKTLTSPVLNTVDINGGDISSATTINKSPTITLGGDLSGSVTLTELGNGTLTATITANSVALGTDTTGNYVATIAAGEGIDVSGSGSETAAVTISAEDATDSNKGIASFDATDFSVSSGDVTLNAERVQDIVGGMVSSNTESGIAVAYQDSDGTLDFDVDDFTLTLGGDLSGNATITNLGDATLTATIAANSVALGTDTTGNFVADLTAGEGIDVSGGGSENATITVSAEDATSSNKGIASFDSTDFTVSSGAVTVNAERVQDIVGAMVGSNTESGIAVTYEDSDGTLDFNVADPVITLSGDVAGSATMTNLGDVTISTTIQANSIALGTDTTGNYVSAISAGEGIDVSGSGSETATVTISAEDATDSNKGIASFDATDFTVSSGDVTVNAERIQDIVGAMFSSNTESGISVTYEDSDGTIDLDVSDPTLTFTGDVTGSGTITNLGNTSIALTVAANSVALGTDTTGNYVATIADAGNSRITVANSGSETAAVTLDIADDAIGSDQIANNAVALSTQTTGNYVAGISGTSNEIEVSGSGSEGATVTIGLPDDVTIGGGLTVTGDLTVNGTTTTINTTNLDIEDATLRIAKNATTLSATNGAGLEFGGSSSKPSILWNNSDGRLVSNKIFAATSFVGDVAGNATTATTLETARTIHGVSFDGSANIDLSEVVQDTVGAMFSSNTETGITATYQDSDGTIDLVIGTLNQDTTGNAATATALETARTIHGVSFDGTANIDLSEVVQDTVGAMFSSNTETGVTVTYEDSDGTIDLVVDTSAISETLTNKTITNPTISDPELSGTVLTAPSENTVQTLVVTVASKTAEHPYDGGSSNAYVIDGVEAPYITLTPDTTYRFDQSDNTNSGHPLAFYFDANKAVSFSTGVTTNGTAGSSGAYTQIIATAATPTALFYQCTNHALMGNRVNFDTRNLTGFDTDDLGEGSTNLYHTTERVQDVVGAMFSSNTETGIAATYEDSDGTIDLVIGSGVITNAMLAGSIANAKLANSAITVSDGSNSTATALGGTITFAAGEGLDVAESSGTVTFSGEDATSSNKGIASFTGDFSVSSGAVSLGASGVTADDYGSATAIPVLSIDAKGRVTSASTASVTTSFTLSDGSNTQTIAGGNTLTVAGTSNEVDVAVSATDTLTIGLPNDVTVSNNLTVSGNLVVSGTTTQTGSVVTDNNFTGLANANSGNSTDFGFYGKYVESSTTKYAGIFYDASTDNTFRIFCDTQTVPSTTVNTGATGYAAANLIIGALTTSGITIGGTAVTSTAAELNILDGVTSTTAELNILDGVTSTTAELNILDGVTATTAELNTLDGSAVSVLDAANGAFASGDGFLTFDGSNVNFKYLGIDVIEAFVESSTDTLAALTSIGGSSTTTNVVGNLTVNTNAFAVDRTNSRIGIGQGTPTVAIDAGSKTDAILLPKGTTAQRPSGAAGQLRFNTTLSRFEGHDGTSFGEIGGSGTSTSSLSVNTFTGDGSETAFTLSQAPESEDNVIVFIEGVYQNPNDFVLNGTTLTFDVAPANTRKIVVYHVKGAVSGSNMNLDTMTGDGSDTTLTLSINPVNENNVSVYIDGVYQNKDTFSISGTTLTFSEAPPSGTKVEAITINQTDVNTATILKDADEDTKIQVEESSDEDVIRFDVGGTEYMTLTSNGKLNVTEIAHISSGNLEIGNGDEKQIFDASGATIQFQTADTERLRISGNNLHLNGGTDARIQLGTGGAGANQVSNNTVHIRGDGTSMKLMAASGGSYLYEVNGTEKMRLESTGKLTLAADAGYIGDDTSGILQLRTHSTAGGWGISARNYTNTTTGYWYIGKQLNGTNIFSMTSDSDSIDLNFLSDERMKMNITDSADVLDKVKQITVKDFDWRTELNGDSKDDSRPSKEYGFIAQNFQDIGLGQYVKELMPTDESDDTLGMDYGNITPILVKAMQEQQAIIETQQTTINDLKSRIETLEGS